MGLQWSSTCLNGGKLTRCAQISNQLEKQDCFTIFRQKLLEKWSAHRKSSPMFQPIEFLFPLIPENSFCHFEPRTLVKLSSISISITKLYEKSNHFSPVPHRRCSGIVNSFLTCFINDRGPEFVLSSRTVSRLWNHKETFSIPFIVYISTSGMIYLVIGSMYQVAKGCLLFLLVRELRMKKCLLLIALMVRGKREWKSLASQFCESTILRCSFDGFEFFVIRVSGFYS